MSNAIKVNTKASSAIERATAAFKANSNPVEHSVAPSKVPFHEAASAQAASPESVSTGEQSPISVPSSPESSPLNQLSGQSTVAEGTSPSQEGAPKAVSEDPKEAEQPLSQQYAILARKEKALRARVQAQEAAFKAKEDALKQREEALSSKDAEYQSGYISKDSIKNDPWSTLSELGIGYDQLTEMVLNTPQTDPATKAYLQRLEKQIQDQQKSIDDSKKGQEQQQKQAYDQAIKQIRREAETLVGKDDTYELIRETGSVSDVVDLIEQTYKSDGVVLSVDEAAKEVEEYLAEEAFKLAKIKKIQQKMGLPKAEAPKLSEAPQAPQSQQKQMNTLTNAVGTTKRLSREERALLAFKNQLK